MNDYERRFGGIQRLYGAEGLARLRRAHVCVVGIGGVGSWAVEALARSGIGALTLVDLDDICVSNVNRQLHSLDDQIGRAKVEVMAGRVRGINPDCVVRPMPEFFNAATAEKIFDVTYDCVLDAIDNVANKCRLIAFSHARKIPIVTCGGAGGRRDATAIRVADLAQTSHDRLLQAVRAGLRQSHGFPRGDKPFGIEAIFSTERPVFPQADGSVCVTRSENSANESLRLNCESGFGAAAFVTGTFGFAAAGLAVRRIAATARLH